MSRDTLVAVLVVLLVLAAIALLGSDYILNGPGKWALYGQDPS